MPLGGSFFEDVYMVKCMHLAVPCLPGESYPRQFCSLLCLCEIF